ncbi:MAG: DUF4433 domain-containing protein [Runella slithyformis]|nr:MAG: DUF4433 domain-containing protein [Runella slithyformis]TAF25042.1 MAG: DUF4433 domain-containing protein [Runella slithyformis]TAG23559.1 MAG: DUF4433 domain-containing protein [Cytophagales bacterium]TAG42829.1 MAG: DUF4433 domain-containing protein [Cytophagia bacterium]TAG76358.1 MAG: DUF4433 domain-containing protein [Cytophagales bacterium]
MTHIENISHILHYGITHHTSVNANPNFIPIGDGSLIAMRNNFLLNNGKRLGEYIPFYFGARTPMLYVVQKGFNMVAPILAENIVYCVTSVQKMIDKQLNFVFTDGHAVDGFTSQYSTADIENISTIIDWNAIKARYWRSDTDLDLKRRKEAEFLILGDISNDAVLGFLVSNENAKSRLIAFGVETTNVHVRPDYYF